LLISTVVEREPEMMGDVALPREGRHRIARRTLAVLVAAVAMGWILHGGLISQGLKAFEHASWSLLAAGFLVALGGLCAAAMAQRSLMTGMGVAVTPIRAARVILPAHAMTASLPAGGAVSAAWSFRQWREQGAQTTEAGAVLVIACVLNWAAAIAVGSVAAASRVGPIALLPLLVGALTLVGIEKSDAGRRVLGKVLSVSKRLIGRPRGESATVAGQVWTTLRGCRLTSRSGASAAGWLMVSRFFDCGALAVACVASGARVQWPALVAAWGLAKVLSVVPLAPGGLGTVDGGLIAVLTASGATPGAALASVLAYRLVSQWLPAVVGWAVHAAGGPARRRARAHPLRVDRVLIAPTY
jgi:uncharacterized membrane protein YbhN (UPF0104 family)